jgi:general secretion pathway protein K
MLRRLFQPVRNQKGVALIIAIFSLILMIFIANEVSYDSSVEYLVASQQVNRLKAYYAAKAGVEISLLRILVFKKLLAAFGDQLKGNESMVDPVWQFPFSWPPALPDDLSGTDKDNIQKVVKDSWMDAKYVATIASEGSRIDINDLGAFMPEGKGLRDATKAQVLKIFTNQMQNDEVFRRKWGAFNFEELVNNMVDWADEDTESLNGGDEKRYYPDAHSDFIPPNKPYKTVEELHMVAGMNEEFYKLLKDRITVYGTKGINVNYCSGDVLKALDERITDNVITAIMKRRNDPNQGGFFKDETDFYSFLDSQGVKLDRNSPTRVQLFFGPELNFRITSSGVFANTTREITAVTFDYDNIRERYVSFMNTSQQPTNGGLAPVTQPSASQTSGQTAKFQAPSGRPPVVYWREN